MIKAKFSSWGISSLALSFFLFAVAGSITFIFLWAGFGGGHVKKGSMSPVGAIVFALFSLFIMFITIYAVRRFAFIILIDTAQKTISFKNIIGIKTTINRFSDFDCFFDTYSVSKSGAYKNIYLIKNGKAKKIISGFYYANMDEVQEALHPIQYLGFQENSSAISRKALFNMQVINTLKTKEK